MRRARVSGVRFTVRLKGEELEAVDRLCAIWRLSRVGTLRRAVLESAAHAGASEGSADVGKVQGVVPAADIEGRLAALEARLQAEWGDRLRKLDDKIDYVSLLLDERTATRTNWAESFAEYEGRRNQDIGADEDGKAEPLVEVTPEAPAKEPRRYARRPGQGRPLAPVREILAGEHVEIDVSGQ